MRTGRRWLILSLLAAGRPGRASQSTGSGEPAQEEGEETAGLEINQGGCDCRPEQFLESRGDDPSCLGGAQEVEGETSDRGRGWRERVLVCIRVYACVPRSPPPPSLSLSCFVPLHSLSPFFLRSLLSLSFSPFLPVPFFLSTTSAEGVFHTIAPGNERLTVTLRLLNKNNAS